MYTPITDLESFWKQLYIPSSCPTVYARDIARSAWGIIEEAQQENRRQGEEIERLRLENNFRGLKLEKYDVVGEIQALEMQRRGWQGHENCTPEIIADYDGKIAAKTERYSQIERELKELKSQLQLLNNKNNDTQRINTK